MHRKRKTTGIRRWMLYLPAFLLVVSIAIFLIIGPLELGLFSKDEASQEDLINENGDAVFIDELEKNAFSQEDEDYDMQDIENQDEDGEQDDDQDFIIGSGGNASVSDSSYILMEDGIEYDYRIIKDGYYLLALVSKETQLKSDYVPSDLQPIPSYMYPSYDMQLRSKALEFLKAMWHEAYNDNVILRVRSAYRSYYTQDGLFRDYANRYGEEEANRFSAKPGQSEHQLGTTVDFGGTAYDWTAEFAQTKEGKWLKDNAYRFGFALSYPENKEYVTGYIYEPWHYRFIGIDEAREWRASGKTLLEYLKTKPQDFE